jgi:hypothetical protein
MHLDDAARPDPRRRGQTDDLTFSIAGMTASKTATKSLRQTLLCRIVRGQAMPCLSSQSTATSGCLSQELGCVPKPAGFWHTSRQTLQITPLQHPTSVYQITGFGKLIKMPAENAYCASESFPDSRDHIENSGSASFRVTATDVRSRVPSPDYASR